MTGELSAPFKRLSEQLHRMGLKMNMEWATFHFDPASLVAMAFERILPRAQHLLLDSLKIAMNKSREYPPNSELGVILMNVFSKPGMISYNNEKIQIYTNALHLAGNWGDWNEGVEAARAVTSSKPGHLHILWASEFWRERLYKPAREGGGGAIFKRDPAIVREYGIMKYGEIWQERISNWGDLAPYWLLLEHGNIDAHGRGGRRGGHPYPVIMPSHFIEYAEQRIGELLNIELIQLGNELELAIDKDIERFLLSVLAGIDQPQGFEVGFEFSPVVKDAMRYRRRITPGWKLGIQGRPVERI